MNTKIYTSESVTSGHPDKVCDIIADAVLDDCLKSDSEARVACEVMATKNKIIVSGEITSIHKPDYEKIVKDTVKQLGYEVDNLKVEVLVNSQSPDISASVAKSFEAREQNSLDENDGQGAGDQGIMYGYACDETEELMPLSFVLAKGLTNRLTQVREQKIIDGLMPDGKSQVTVQFEDKNVKILNILVSTQHKESLSLDKLREEVKKFVIDPVFKDYDLNKTQILINPSGRFVLGGYEADTGVTGRKLQVDSYGTICRQGGGAYSGKDPSKVDRSGAYICRYIAKNIVAAKLAKKCEVSLCYAIGKAQPLSFNVEFFGTQTNKKHDEKTVENLIKKLVDLRPKAIINNLNLKSPIYFQTAKVAHFGVCDYPWERLDLKDKLLNILV
ncbi:MAG: methionine adenosyltransferase [Spirochaetales bacterium]